VRISICTYNDVETKPRTYSRCVHEMKVGRQLHALAAILPDMVVLRDDVNVPAKSFACCLSLLAYCFVTVIAQVMLQQTGAVVKLH
jgi:hypothetical protein